MPDTGRPPTQRLPAAERRRQLLDVALETFAERGYHATSMNDVAEAAGVTKPVLYQHFASKEALHRELVEAVGAGLQHAVMDAVRDADGPRAQVENGFRAYFRWATHQRAAFRLLFDDRNAERELATAVGDLESLVADRVAELIVVEGLSEDERRVLAYGVVGLAESVSRHWLRLDLGAGDDAESFADQVAQLAWSGLRGVAP